LISFTMSPKPPEGAADRLPNGPKPGRARRPNKYTAGPGSGQRAICGIRTLDRPAAGAARPRRVVVGGCQHAVARALKLV
ncbi:MAG TPA: hypothetical protein VG713_19240, partial [Pirellulales bacterium]|nr:hypothetical protein [Pirellulales bacterium]